MWTFKKGSLEVWRPYSLSFALEHFPPLAAGESGMTKRITFVPGSRAWRAVLVLAFIVRERRRWNNRGRGTRERSDQHVPRGGFNISGHCEPGRDGTLVVIG